MNLFYLMGPTCAGKGTAIQHIKQHHSAWIGFVEVGNEFRRRYPPNYFKGQANPAHLRQEAIKIYAELLEAEKEKGYDTIIVDGQPREGQVDPILKLHPDDAQHFILLHAPKEVRAERLGQRFTQGTDNYDLGLKRVTNDQNTYYEVLVELLRLDQPVRLIDTDRGESEWIGELVGVVCEKCTSKSA